MTKRTQISKKLRFEVLKRDNFQCLYCGNKPPDVILEIDHVVPVAKGGLTIIQNLVTSCFNCNRGKSDRSLLQIPENVYNETRKKQLREYKKYLTYLKDEQIVKDVSVQMICEIYEDHYGYYLSQKDRSTVASFIGKLSVSELKHSMEVACNRVWKTDAIRYFCGVCYNKIKKQKNDPF